MNSNLVTKAGWWAALAWTVFAYPLQPIAADDFVMSPAAFASLPPGGQDTVKAQAQQYANGMLNHLLLKLDEADRICSLTDGQESKLKVAAKGAVEFALQNWIDAASVQLAGAGAAAAAVPAAAVQRQQLIAHVDEINALQQRLQIALQEAQAAGGGRRGARQAVQAQQINQLNQQAAQLAQMQQQLQLQQRQVEQLGQRQVIEEVIVNDNGVNRVVRRVRRVPAIPVLDVTAVDQQHVWTAALDNTLTAEQKQRLSARATQRSANLDVVTPTGRIVTQLDNLLLLDGPQREKMSELVSKTLESPANKSAFQRNQPLTPALIARIIRSLPANEISALLSPTQMTRWQQSVLSSPSTATRAVAPPANARPAVPLDVIDAPVRRAAPVR
jgi:hypothetical protein